MGCGRGRTSGSGGGWERELLEAFQEEVDVVQAVQEAIFLVAVDVEVLAVAGGHVGDGLGGQVHAHLRLRVLRDAGKELLLEGFADDDRQHEAVEEVVAMDVSKGTADDHAHAIAGNGPGGVFARGTAAPVLAGHDDLVNAFAGCRAVGRLVHDEIGHGLPVGIEAEVVHEGIAEEFRVACGAGQVAGRNNQVCVTVVYLDGDAGGLHNRQGGLSPPPLPCREGSNYF